MFLQLHEQQRVKPRLGFAGRQAGGIGLPRQVVGGVSRSIGLVGVPPTDPQRDAAADAVGVDYDVSLEGGLDLELIFGKFSNAKLIGSITLGDLLGQVPAVRESIASLPKLTKRIKDGLAPLKQAVQEAEAEARRAIKEIVQAFESAFAGLDRVAQDAVDAMRGSADFLETALNLPALEIRFDKLVAHTRGEIDAALGAVSKRTKGLVQEHLPSSGRSEEELAALEEYRKWTARIEDASSQVMVQRLVEVALRSAIDATWLSDVEELVAGLRERARGLARAAGGDIFRLVDDGAAFLRDLGDYVGDVTRAIRDLVPSGEALVSIELKERILAALGSVIRDELARLRGEARRVASVLVDFVDTANIPEDPRRGAFARWLKAANAVDYGAWKRELRAAARRVVALEDGYSWIEARVRAWLAGPHRELLERMIASKIDAAASQVLAFLDVVRDPARLLRDLVTKIPREVEFDYDFATRLRDWPEGDPLFVARLEGPGAGGPAAFVVRARVRLGLDDAGRPRATQDVTTSVERFAIRLIPSFNFLQVDFREISVRLDDAGEALVDVKIENVGFGQELDFVKAFQDWFLARGIVFEVAARGITAGFRFKLPSLQFGAFSIFDLSFGLRVDIPFDGSELRTGLEVSQESKPFIIQAGILGGGGWFGIVLEPQRLYSLSFGFEFGGTVALNIGVAQGTAYVRAGIAYESRAGVARMTGFLRAGGSFSILGIVHMEVAFYMGISYARPDGQSFAYGVAELRITIKYAFLKIGVTLRYEKVFKGGDARGDADLMRGEAAPRQPELCSACTRSQWDAWEEQYTWI